MRELSKESSLFSRYYMINAEREEARNILISMIPQFSLELYDSDNKYKGILGMYESMSTYTSLAYNDSSSTKDIIYSLNGETDYIIPMITMFSMSYLQSTIPDQHIYCLNLFQ